MVPRVRFLMSPGLVAALRASYQKIREYRQPEPSRPGFYTVTAWRLETGVLFGLDRGAAYYFDPDRA